MCPTAMAIRACTNMRRTASCSSPGAGLAPIRASSTARTASPAMPAAGCMWPTARTIACRCSTETCGGPHRPVWWENLSPGVFRLLQQDACWHYSTEGCILGEWLNCQSAAHRSFGLNFNAGKFDHLVPLLDFFSDEPAEVARRAGKRRAADLGDPCLRPRIDKSGVELLVELLHDLGRRAA